MKNRTRTLALAGSAALLATLIGAAPAPAAPSAPKAASVHGAGKVFYPFSPEDDIRFTVDADGDPWSLPLKLENAEKGLPTDARGWVTVHHGVHGSDFAAVSRAKVDCLVTGGGTATLTAVVETSNVGWEGMRIGISVQDGRHGEPDRVGFSWGVANLDVHPDLTATQATVGTCMAPAPFTEVVKGGFKVASAPLTTGPR
ncbi:hypothetical protein [Streptomyces sp. NBC_00454]|uniref:hypothetical protein n=1 Tax=Streptomyces sp. NBC_00454 TaxID=2975747 RepID=UPI0030E4061A